MGIGESHDPPQDHRPRDGPPLRWTGPHGRTLVRRAPLRSIHPPLHERHHLRLQELGLRHASDRRAAARRVVDHGLPGHRLHQPGRPVPHQQRRPGDAARSGQGLSGSRPTSGRPPDTGSWRPTRLHQIARVSLVKSALGSLSINAVTSRATASHCSDGFHATTTTHIGGLSFTPPVGPAQSFPLPTPDHPLTIPGLATIYAGQHSTHRSGTARRRERLRTARRRDPDRYVAPGRALLRRARLRHDRRRLQGSLRGHPRRHGDWVTSSRAGPTR